VRYELGFISQKTAFFIVTAVKTSNLTYLTARGFSAYVEAILSIRKYERCYTDVTV
jgi:hypothetical protein